MGIVKTAITAMGQIEQSSKQITDIIGIIDEIVPEPPGGAHLNHDEAGRLLDAYLSDALDSVRKLSCEKRLESRYEKFRKMGSFEDRNSGANPKVT